MFGNDIRDKDGVAATVTHIAQQGPFHMAEASHRWYLLS